MEAEGFESADESPSGRKQSKKKGTRKATSRRVRNKHILPSFTLLNSTEELRTFNSPRVVHGALELLQAAKDGGLKVVQKK